MAKKKGGLTFFKNFTSFFVTHKTFSLILVFLAVWVTASIIFYLRFQNNLIYPNFFAEDGQHFVQNIINDSFISATFTPFNGYLITGVYLLTGTGFIVNALFFGAHFIFLPASLAIVSYGFFGLCAALPVLLLRRYLKVPYLIFIALLISLLPLPAVDYAILGTIGNVKFAFAYIAFLLVLYRITLPRTAKRIFLIDALLAICALTTLGAYFALPFILLSDGLKVNLKKVFSATTWKPLFKRSNVALWSGLALVAIAVGQILYILINGLPELPNYLNEPYQPAKTIEIFLGRAYLYPIIALIYDHLSDLIVVALFIAMVVATALFGKKEHRPIYILGYAMILAISLLFVANRTGVSVHFINYSTTAFDNFFYTQNFIFIVMLGFLLSDIISRLKGRWMWLIPIIAAGALLIPMSYLRENNALAPNDFMQYQNGSIYEQSEELCKSSADPITFSVYPFVFLTMDVSRDDFCGANISQYTSMIQDFGLTPTEPLETLNIGPGDATFTQTFTADTDNLSGLAVYLSTYYVKTVNHYNLNLYESDCTTQLRQVAMPIQVKDNAYRLVSFAPIENSKNKTYCFSIAPTPDAQQKLALQLSQPNILTTGDLLVNATSNQRDVVFQAIYTN